MDNITCVDTPGEESLTEIVVSAQRKNEGNDVSTRNVKTIDGSESAINTLLSNLPQLNNCFHIHGKIGEGTFSNVYLASLKGFSNDRRFAIKHLIPTCHPKRTKYELDCLNRIGGKDNVVSCDMTMRQADCIVFIMPYLQHQKFADYVLEMTVEEARLYMQNLLLALRRVHSFNIIHRDVKPSNFLYNRDTKQFLLVDFGLAQKATEHEDNAKIKPTVQKIPVTKRKREDDDSENAENGQVKRCALRTLTGDMMNKSEGRTTAVMQQNRKWQRQPLTPSSTNDANKPTFQSLMPHKVLSTDSGASFVRVQNSQVQFPRPTAPVRRMDSCQCTGKPQVCNTCITRKAQFAPRAGTPGFRPPEVLLKYPYQTTAVDMWSAGVIMLCILSGCYPFFRSPDDITALSEIITVFGSGPIKDLAKKLGRNVICSEDRKPLNLRLLCESLRRRKVDRITGKVNQPLCGDCHHWSSDEYGCLCEDKSRLDLSTSVFPPVAFDLLAKLLDINPTTRISADGALQHPFIRGLTCVTP